MMNRVRKDIGIVENEAQIKNINKMEATQTDV